MPHGIGVIDIDYSGDEDELFVQVYNFSNTDVTITKGEKIAQGVFVRIDKAKFEEVETMNNKTRGGFGTTNQ
jgi:dUTP pyrophosphatase